MAAALLMSAISGFPLLPRPTEMADIEAADGEAGAGEELMDSEETGAVAVEGQGAGQAEAQSQWATAGRPGRN
jgi:hypothetical protein